MTAPAGISIRLIQPSDNSTLAIVIRGALTEFGANKPGTVYYDATTDALFDLFQTPGSFYLVAVAGEQLLGGAGIFPTAGLPDGICELVKMYLHRDARGRGLGRLLIKKCLEQAKIAGYSGVYLESMPELGKAVSIYEKFGFRHLTGPRGHSGHFGCGVWMQKDL